MASNLDRTIEDLKQQPVGPKFGEGALQAFLRQGLKELSQAVPAFPDSVRVIEEPGAIGNITPQHVADQMGRGMNMQQDLPEPTKEREIEMGN
jgi:hypothetical protein